MSGTFIAGEQKVRPGAYFRIQKSGGDTAYGNTSGVTAVIFRADTGPLNKAVELGAEEGYAHVFGTGLTTDALREAYAGGARTIIACRAGNGGEPGAAVLQDAEGADALTVTARYPGEKEFSITVREKLSDSAVKECIIYSGTEEYERHEFPSGEGEAGALAEALSRSGGFRAQAAAGKENSVLADVSQSPFAGGRNPEAAAEDYSNALAQVEPYEFNTICVDTEDTEIHLLLQSFLKRIFNAGSLAAAVVAEKHTVPLEDRMAHAAAFNDEKMVYVLNAHVNEQGTEIDGYQTAARIAGMIGAASSGTSLTHAPAGGFTEALERLTNTQTAAAEKSGCLVLSHNRKKQVWIDNAINTLVEPSEDQDGGWKKIRRVMARFELIRRINAITDDLIGKVDNDINGRSTVAGRIQEAGDAMREEGKLVSCRVSESGLDAADGDSAWFDIDVVDKDSMEHIYLTFKFQFSTNI